VKPACRRGREARLQNPVRTDRNGIQRPSREGEQAHLYDARNKQSLLGRCGGNRRKEYVLTWGDLRLYELPFEKSAEAIVVTGNEPVNRRRTHPPQAERAEHWIPSKFDGEHRIGAAPF
jgi:hypothetical protein